jgi:hypothetical protein
MSPCSSGHASECKLNIFSFGAWRHSAWRHGRRRFRCEGIFRCLWNVATCEPIVYIMLLNKQAFLCSASCSSLNPPQSHLFLTFTSFHVISFSSFHLTISSEEIAIAIAITCGHTRRVAFLRTLIR